MMIPATMIKIAPPRTAIAISPGEYFVSFLAGPVGGCRPAFFFFLRGFFDMTLLCYLIVEIRCGRFSRQMLDARYWILDPPVRGRIGGLMGHTLENASAKFKPTAV